MGRRNANPLRCATVTTALRNWVMSPVGVAVAQGLAVGANAATTVALSLTGFSIIKDVDQDATR